MLSASLIKKTIAKYTANTHTNVLIGKRIRETNTGRKPPLPPLHASPSVCSNAKLKTYFTLKCVNNSTRADAKNCTSATPNTRNIRTSAVCGDTPATFPTTTRKLPRIDCALLSAPRSSRS